MHCLFNGGQWFKGCAKVWLVFLKVKTEPAKLFAIPLMCCSFIHLGMVVASKPHVLHFSLSVLPVKIFGGVYGLNALINQSSISRMSIFN